MRKRSAIARGIAVNMPDKADAFDVLGKLGGFDMAAMAGAFIGGALYRVPTVIDGFISSVAALIAARLCQGAALQCCPATLRLSPRQSAL
ncbi:MAG: nicotinate-nucleotide--dimethylbenzimidazole phosphoribosyltransferase [Christensenellales bacterium]